jgi:hypothetical protein
MCPAHLRRARLLLVKPAERGTRRGRRALSVFSRAVLVSRWFRESAPVARLAGDTDIGISSCYRNLHKGIDVLAAQAPRNFLMCRGNDSHVATAM